MTGSMKLQPDDGPRYSLSIEPSSDNAMRSRRKFTRRFTKGIGKLAVNVKGDHRKEDQRTCRKITGVCGRSRLAVIKEDDSKRSLLAALGSERCMLQLKG
ncbi:hypothetical protein B296_00014584 [Ensete ventricosum]|uniref:Uncharacterized protein n=1 Tax=Ensete ventricosum TaxID=4639 RepID=A0A426ZRN7_ENSVE|nr:hypothetical protein B296_00014584 [Ensete ventricosum]